MTDLVERLVDDLMAADGVNPEFARKAINHGYDAQYNRYRQLAIQAITTLRFYLEQGGDL